MAHSHGHTGHSHHGGRSANQKALFISFGLIFTFMMIEVIGGILTNSLALLSDAGHMLSDSAALGFSLLAFKIGEKAASASKTFGYRRFEILGAFINGITLLLISLYIFWEAYNRFFSPPEVAGRGMLAIATVGLFVNILCGLGNHERRHKREFKYAERFFAHHRRYAGLFRGDHRGPPYAFLQLEHRRSNRQRRRRRFGSRQRLAGDERLGAYINGRKTERH